MKHLPPKYITLHAAATYPSMDIDIQWIKDIHVKQRGWSDVGYHYFIQRDGTMQKGRPDYRLGAHVGGHNTGNLGVCMAGGLKEGTKQPEDNFTPEQWETLNGLLDKLLDEYPDAEIVGHNYFPRYKSRGCPCFDWETYGKWVKDMREAMYAPEDWYTFDWHVHSPDDYQLPEDFYEAVEKK